MPIHFWVREKGVNKLYEYSITYWKEHELKILKVGVKGNDSV